MQNSSFLERKMEQVFSLQWDIIHITAREDIYIHRIEFSCPITIILLCKDNVHFIPPSYYHISYHTGSTNLTFNPENTNNLAFKNIYLHSQRQRHFFSALLKNACLFFVLSWGVPKFDVLSRPRYC